MPVVTIFLEGSEGVLEGVERDCQGCVKRVC